MSMSSMRSTLRMACLDEIEQCDTMGTRVERDHG